MVIGGDIPGAAQLAGIDREESTLGPRVRNLRCDDLPAL